MEADLYTKAMFNANIAANGLVGNAELAMIIADLHIAAGNVLEALPLVASLYWHAFCRIYGIHPPRRHDAANCSAYDDCCCRGAGTPLVLPRVRSAESG